MNRELISGKAIDDAKKNVTAAITHVKSYGAPPRPCTSGECELVSQYLMNIGLALKELDSAARALDDCLHLVSDINALATMHDEIAELDAQNNNQKKGKQK